MGSSWPGVVGGKEVFLPSSPITITIQMEWDEKRREEKVMASTGESRGI